MAVWFEKLNHQCFFFLSLLPIAFFTPFFTGLAKRHGECFSVSKRRVHNSRRNRIRRRKCGLQCNSSKTRVGYLNCVSYEACLRKKALRIWDKPRSLTHRELSILLKVKTIFNHAFLKHFNLQLENHQNIVRIDGLIRSNQNAVFRGCFLKLMECSLSQSMFVLPSLQLSVIHNTYAQGEMMLSSPREYNCKDVARWIKQINNGLVFLYGNNIIYRDIKPEK